MATYNGHNEDSSGNLLLSIGNGMTATVETGTTASQSYTKGSYIFFNNRLCKTTTAITSGATLSIGTNLSQTSLGAELTSHLRSSDGKEFYFDVKDGDYGYYPSASKVASEFVPFGGTSQTVLWTNPNPPTSTFGTVDVPLSDSARNYDLLMFKFRRSTTIDDILYGMVDVPFYLTSESGNRCVPIGTNNKVNGYMRCRELWYNSDTSLHFFNPRGVGASGTDTGVLIPLAIIGVKDFTPIV